MPLVVQLGEELTQVSIDQLAVVHLSSHGSDLLQLGLLSLHAILQPLQLLRFRLNQSTSVMSEAPCGRMLLRVMQRSLLPPGQDTVTGGRVKHTCVWAWLDLPPWWRYRSLCSYSSKNSKKKTMKKTVKNTLLSFQKEPVEKQNKTLRWSKI